MANKILFSNSKMFFPLAMWGSRYVKQISICMHPSNACLLSLTKTKGKILLHRGIAWVTLFIVLDLKMSSSWKKTSLDRSQQKGWSPKQCPACRNCYDRVQNILIRFKLDFSGIFVKIWTRRRTRQ